MRREAARVVEKVRNKRNQRYNCMLCLQLPTSNLNTGDFATKISKTLFDWLWVKMPEREHDRLEQPKMKTIGIDNPQLKVELLYDTSWHLTQIQIITNPWWWYILYLYLYGPSTWFSFAAWLCLKTLALTLAIFAIAAPCNLPRRRPSSATSSCGPREQRRSSGKRGRIERPEGRKLREWWRANKQKGHLTILYRHYCFLFSPACVSFSFWLCLKSHEEELGNFVKGSNQIYKII